MNTLTKLALSIAGHPNLRARDTMAATDVILPKPETTGGLGLMEALRGRQSNREFISEPLSQQVLGNLLWAACGVNRSEDGGRTVPSAMNAQEVDVYLALPQGLYLYNPRHHALQLVVAKDVRTLTGYQDFVEDAPLDLVYVVDHARMSLIPASKRATYGAVCVGAMTQNVALYCVFFGLVNVVRGWFDRGTLSKEFGLGPDQQIVVSQTVGYPKIPGS
jgi:nitroreductase